MNTSAFTHIFGRNNGCILHIFGRNNCLYPCCTLAKTPASYNINFATGGGLTFDDNGIKIQDCAAGELLKYINATDGWKCSSDLDTINDRVWARRYVNLAGLTLGCSLTGYGRQTCRIPGTEIASSTAGHINFSGSNGADLTWASYTYNSNFSGVPAVTVSYDTAGGGGNFHGDLCGFNLWNVTSTGFDYDFACPNTGASTYQVTLVQLSIMAIMP
jgi:hypothetical protein